MLEAGVSAALRMLRDASASFGNLQYAANRCVYRLFAVTSNVMAEEKLINLVRLHECLYNIKSRHYSDQHMKHNAWEQIAKELNKTRK